MGKLTKSAKEVRGRHQLTVRVKTSKYRDKSSNKWLARQLNDPYVAESKRLGYRSRAAFKLIQLDEKYKFLGKGKRIVDLGCAPGGWTQVAVMRNKGAGKVVGIYRRRSRRKAENTVGRRSGYCHERYGSEYDRPPADGSPANDCSG